MAKITAGNIIAQNPHASEVYFTGTDCYNYVNGLVVAGPDDGTALLPFGADDVFALEIHDQRIQSSTPTNMKRPVHPELIWSSIKNADRYNIYHTQPGGNETLIYIKTPEENRLVYHLRVPIECERGWNFFRIEAVDSGGTESTRAVWGEYVYDLPDAPSSVSLAGSAGTFTITAA